MRRSGLHVPVRLPAQKLARGSARNRAVDNAGRHGISRGQAKQKAADATASLTAAGLVVYGQRDSTHRSFWTLRQLTVLESHARKEQCSAEGGKREAAASWCGAFDPEVTCRLAHNFCLVLAVADSNITYDCTQITSSFDFSSGTFASLVSFDCGGTNYLTFGVRSGPYAQRHSIGKLGLELPTARGRPVDMARRVEVHTHVALQRRGGGGGMPEG